MANDTRDPSNSFARFAINPDRFVRIKSEVALPQSVCLALLGGFSGLVGAEPLCALMRNSASAFASLKVSLTPDVALAVLLVAAGVGTAGAIPPAWRVSHRSILDSLRCTG